ncbi:hypothetical protein LEN26_014671 [Aphanomyces euteiches]|nr:hypothetical protein LEN26_014671 [Aphanomyces euteiches]
MQCKQPHLQGKLKELRKLEKQLTRVDYHHVLRRWNASADHLATMGMQHRGKAPELIVEDLNELQEKNLLAELLQDQEESQAKQVESISFNSTHDQTSAPETRKIWAFTHPKPNSTTVGLSLKIRLGRISRAQDREKRWSTLKNYLKGNFDELEAEDISKGIKEAGSFEIGEENALYRLNWSRRRSPEPQLVWSLVIPADLVPMVLQHAHDSLESGHLRFQNTYERLRRHFFWPGMYTDAKQYVEACEVCALGGPSPRIAARSPGNLLPTRPMDLINMDIATDLPRTPSGNTQLVVFVDNFTGWIMCKPTADRQARTLARAFEEAVFNRFGACREVRHDREPSLMGEVFSHFASMLGQVQLSTFAYRPQANGTAERAIQTLTRSIKAYVSDPQQRDWDQYASRLALAINTVPSATRGETPFFLMHGWDPFTTLTASLPLPEEHEDPDARQWRLAILDQHAHAQKAARELLKAAVRGRAEAHNARTSPAVEERIRVGDKVWLYIDQVKPGVKKKLAHLWHGPFRVVQRVTNYSSVLEMQGRRKQKNHRQRSEVHDSRLKLYRTYTPRPADVLDTQPPVDFDEEMYLPEDSFEPGEPFMEIFGVRDIRYTRSKEFEVQTEKNGPWSWIAASLLPA